MTPVLILADDLGYWEIRYYNDQLYNLATDPGEAKDLLFERPEIATELKALLQQSKASGRSNKPAITK